jgi:hypothetical protein
LIGKRPEKIDQQIGTEFKNIEIEGENSLSPQETIILEKDVVDTSDWQIYRNQELGIEFTYPSGALIKNIPTGAEEADWILSIIPEGEIAKFSNDKMFAYFAITSFKTFDDPQNWSSIKLGEDKAVDNNRTLTINNFPAYYTRVNTSYIDHNYIITNKKGKIVIISFREIECCYGQKKEAVLANQSVIDPNHEIIHTEYLSTFNILAKSIYFIN